MYGHDSYASRPWADSPEAVAVVRVSGIQFATGEWARDFRSSGSTAFATEPWAAAFQTLPWPRAMVTPEWERDLP